jgi:hypothetical protein
MKGGKLMRNLLLIGLFITLYAIILMVTNPSATSNGTTFIAIDINPSIEFIVDEEQNVISFYLVNEDAMTVVGDTSYLGLPYDKAMHQFMTAALETGFIDIQSMDNEIIITVTNDQEVTNSALAYQAQQHAQDFLMEQKIGGAVINGALIDDALIDLADEYGISVGKARLIKAIVMIEKSVDFEDYTNQPMPSLLNTLTNGHQAQMSFFEEHDQAQAMLRHQARYRATMETLNHHQSQLNKGSIDTPNYERILNRILTEEGINPDTYHKQNHQNADDSTQ